MKRISTVKLVLVATVFYLTATIALILIRNLVSNGDLANQILVLTIALFISYSIFALVIRNFSFDILCVGVVLVIVFFSATQFTLLNIDRSRSFYIIGWVKNHEIKVVNSEYDFTNVNSSEKKNVSAMVFRLNEQKNRGLITDSGSSLTLSDLGNFIYSFAEINAKIFKLNNWELNKS